MKIVVVEDEPALRAAIARIASHSAEVVLEADNGLDALALIEREDPDLVITDLHMPTFDGFELIQAIRQSPQYGKMPIICISVIRERGDIERLIELKVTEYMIKPLNPIGLDERIHRVLRSASDWRVGRRPAPRVTDRTPQVLVIDADPNYRAFVRPLLEPDYEVVEAAGAPEGLTTFKRLETKPDAILISTGSSLLRSNDVANVLGRLCEESGSPVPPTLLLSETLDIDAAETKHFSAVVQRSFVPDQFQTMVNRWLPRRQSPVDRVRAMITGSSNAWLLSAARQTVGVLAGREASVASADSPDATIAVTGDIELDLPENACRLRVFVGCTTEHAAQFAGTVLRRDVDGTGSEASDVLGEFVNTVGGRLKASLVGNGIAATLGLPVIKSEPRDLSGETFDWSTRLEIAGGILLTLGVTLIETGAAAAVASDSTADVDSVLF